MASAGELEVTVDGSTIHLKLVFAPDERLAEAAVQAQRDVTEALGARIVRSVWDRGQSRRGVAF